MACNVLAGVLANAPRVSGHASICQLKAPTVAIVFQFLPPSGELNSAMSRGELSRYRA
jgi:hypothetical protein